MDYDSVCVFCWAAAFSLSFFTCILYNFKIERRRNNIEIKNCKVIARDCKANLKTNGRGETFSLWDASHWPIVHISHQSTISRPSLHSPSEKNSVKSLSRLAKIASPCFMRANGREPMLCGSTVVWNDWDRIFGLIFPQVCDVRRTSTYRPYSASCSAFAVLLGVWPQCNRFNTACKIRSRVACGVRELHT